jgi:hypothetical protein
LAKKPEPQDAVKTELAKKAEPQGPPKGPFQIIILHRRPADLAL